MMTVVSVGLAASTLLGMAVVISYVLGWASKAFHVTVDPRVLQINEVLPGANCAGCGYVGCNDYAEAVARGIKDLLARGEAVWDEGEAGWVQRPAQPGDILILVRQRTGLFEEMIRRLKLYGVPVAGADRMKLPQQLVVEDLMALARFALLPEDDLSLAIVLKSPAFHPVSSDHPPIDDMALFDLSRLPGKRLWDKLRRSEDPRFAGAKSTLDRARARVDSDGPYAFFATFLNEITTTGESRLARFYARLGEEARDPCEEFLSRALAYER